MSCKITFESIITFCEYDLLLILHTSTINVEFYSLSNTFYFIILCYIEQKIYLFLWRPAISSFKCPKKSGQQGSTRHLKVRTLKVNRIEKYAYVCQSLKSHCSGNVSYISHCYAVILTSCFCFLTLNAHQFMCFLMSLDEKHIRNIWTIIITMNPQSKCALTLQTLS